MRIAVVTPRGRSGEIGGAESFYDGLVGALREAPHAVDRVDVTIDESSFDAVLESYLACYDLDLDAYDAVISTKAPAYMVRHPRHVAYLVHTPRVFYDRFAAEYGETAREERKQRAIVQSLDRHGLDPARVVGHFAISHTVYERLRSADSRWEKIAFEVLHPPPALGAFPEPRRGDYVLAAGRLHRWKRIDLLIRAFRDVRRDVRLRIAGIGEDEASLRKLAAGDPRIEFLGRVSENELRDLYAGALAVSFPAVGEDYGLVVIEALRARKPVVTCTDSGEPARFVTDGVNGFVTPPDAEAIAARLRELVDDPDRAAAMGENGPAAVAGITWERVVERLLSAVAAPREGTPRRRPLEVLVTDNQPIEPAVGGGRLRLLALYGDLGDGIHATYVGSYDWSGPKARDLRVTASLREIDVPLGDGHFAANRELERVVPGATTIDVSMPWLVESGSPDLVRTLREHAAGADVVVCSHPWMYRSVRDVVRARAVPLVYDAHNCEALLRRQLLGDSAAARALAEGVREIEAELCRESDLVLACSGEDREAFVRLYGIPRDRVVVVPNGVDVRAIRPAHGAEKAHAKRALRAGAFTAVFVGSDYPPNREAARAIVEGIAPACPEVTFLVVGGCGDSFARACPPNVRLLGAVDDDTRNRAYAAADVALNPVTTGSGIAIKMLDYFAAALATVSTEVGARGLLCDAVIVDSLDSFPEWIERLRGSAELRQSLGESARTLAEREYDRRMLSRRVGERLVALSRAPRGARPPFFSVIVPTYERPAELERLLDALRAQIHRDFEVVVVDQARERREPAAKTLRLRYIHTERRGAVRARNLGIAHATGEVVVFTDDDCIPAPDWLGNARPRFRNPAVVGLEGLVESDHSDETRWRVVTNVGFEGFGFMTANLFIRRSVLDRIGGFDERFDDPHFREDTDLGWRALVYGQIPFGRDVRVLHPAHPRSTERESAEARARFFVQDPLLFAKHPDRYVDLLRAEGNHLKNPVFWEHFMRGMVRHRVRLPLPKLRGIAGREQIQLLEELSRALEARSTSA